MTTTGMFMFGAEVLFHCWADKPIFFIAWRYASPRPMFFFWYHSWHDYLRAEAGRPFRNKTGPLGKQGGLCTNWDQTAENETRLPHFSQHILILWQPAYIHFSARMFFFGTPNAKIIGFPNQMTTHLTCKGFIASLLDLLDAYTVETLVANGPLNNTAKKGVWLCVLS
jgi:hypothetical protein